MSDVKAVKPDEPLDKRTKWSYCVGATGRDMAYALVSMYLITYIQYTMKLTVALSSLLWGRVNKTLFVFFRLFTSKENRLPKRININSKFGISE